MLQLLMTCLQLWFAGKIVALARETVLPLWRLDRFSSISPLAHRLPAARVTFFQGVQSSCNSLVAPTGLPGPSRACCCDRSNDFRETCRTHPSPRPLQGTSLRQVNCRNSAFEKPWGSLLLAFSDFPQFIRNTDRPLTTIHGTLPFPMEPKRVHRKHTPNLQPTPRHITVPDELQEPYQSSDCRNTRQFASPKSLIKRSAVPRGRLFPGQRLTRGTCGGRNGRNDASLQNHLRLAETTAGGGDAAAET